MVVLYENFAADAQLTQQLTFVMQQSKNWEHLGALDQGTMHAIAASIARILNGEVSIALVWDDIASYALAAASARGLR